MAKPRVFISSTFYDLRQVREDLERFVRELGYEPVRNETGSIPYGKEEPPESYAYREVELCDIIVAIIGGRFGTESQQVSGFSISQAELKRAYERGVQVFIFIEQNVMSEYSTYQINKDNKNIKYKYVNDIRIYEFLEQLYQLPRNNTIAHFQISSDIVGYLRTQWAGLFQRFLQDQKRASEIKILDEMKGVAGTLQQLVAFLTRERDDKDEAIKNILLSNHPAFRRFAKITDTRYRVFFTTGDELTTWLKARTWRPVEKDSSDKDSVMEWYNEKINKYIKLTENIFDAGGRLKIYTDNDWRDDWVNVADAPVPEPKQDDLPF